MIDFLFSFKGRISRKSFWLGILALLAIDFAIHFALIGALGSAAYDEASRETHLLKVVELVATLPYYWPTAALFLKRMHDFRQGPALFSAVAILVVLIVGLDFAGAEIPSYVAGLLFLILWIAVGATRGTPGANEYGPDPLA
jgi:uncharacterized membrane protein YhaH (DUF805 family)